MRERLKMASYYLLQAKLRKLLSRRDGVCTFAPALTAGRSWLNVVDVLL